MFKLSHSLLKENMRKGSTIDLLINKRKGLNIKEDFKDFSIFPTSCRPFKMYNSDLNNPKSKYMTFNGIVNSEDNWKIIDGHGVAGHFVINFKKQSTADVTQLIVPVKENRLFIRHSVGDKFTQPQSFVTNEELKSLKQEIFTIKNQLFWEKEIQKISLLGIRKSNDFEKSYFRLFIEGREEYLHYELNIQNKKSAYLHLEAENKEYLEIIKEISLKTNKNFIKKGIQYSIEFDGQNYIDALNKAYLATISFIYNVKC